MQDVTSYLEQARGMLSAKVLDRPLYSQIENFVLKNGSKLAGDSDFAELRRTMSEIALRFHVESVESLQEGFGLNSCAQ